MIPQMIVARIRPLPTAGENRGKVAEHDARELAAQGGYAGDPHQPADGEARRWPERLAGVEVRPTRFSAKRLPTSAKHKTINIAAKIAQRRNKGRL